MNSDPGTPPCHCATGIDAAPTQLTGPLGTENPPGRSRRESRA